MIMLDFWEVEWMEKVDGLERGRVEWEIWEERVWRFGYGGLGFLRRKDSLGIKKNERIKWSVYQIMGCVFWSMGVHLFLVEGNSLKTDKTQSQNAVQDPLIRVKFNAVFLNILISIQRHIPNRAISKNSQKHNRKLKENPLKNHILLL